MPTSSKTIPSTSPRAPQELRLHLSDEASTDRVDGSWCAEDRLSAAATTTHDSTAVDEGAIDWARWDGESPAG
jgi:hypothetical protein